MIRAARDQLEKLACGLLCLHWTIYMPPLRAAINALGTVGSNTKSTVRDIDLPVRIYINYTMIRPAERAMPKNI